MTEPSSPVPPGDPWEPLRRFLDDCDNEWQPNNAPCLDDLYAFVDLLRRQLAVVDGHVRHVEYARAFDHPTPADRPIPWISDFHGEPDLTKAPPSAAKPHPMHWVARIVTVGPWQPLDGRSET